VSHALFWTLLLATNLACGFLGFLFGRMTRATVEIEEHMNHDNDSPPPSAGPPSPRRLTSLRVLAVVVALIGASTVVLGVVVTREQAAADERDDRLTACVVGYSNALGDALEQRVAANTAANDAVDTVMQAFADAFSQLPEEARENLRLAFEHYTEMRREARVSIKANPLPDVPRDACAELLD
jgi:hypothetical protein